jgi:hypothetical protein
MNDWRLAFRSLKQQPRFTVIALLTLVLDPTIALRID